MSFWLGSVPVSATMGLGLFLLYLGERIFGAGSGRTVASSLGGALVLAAAGWRAWRFVRATAERKRVEGMLLWLFGVALAALVLYGLQSDLLASFWPKPFDQSFPRLSVVLQVTWPVLLCGSFLPVLLVEMSYAAMSLSPQVELGRIRDALLSGIGIVAALVFAFSASYVASERDVRWDLSYFRTARPGEATRKLVRTLSEPLTVNVFFPPANEVQAQVMEFLTDLSSESRFLVVENYDFALEPAKAKELTVTGNGAVVLSRGLRREQIVLGVDMEKARTHLKNLDQEFQKRLLMIARARRNVYFTTGHGERAFDNVLPTDQRSTLKTLRELLTALNYEVRDLSAGSGLAAQVPKDAAAVFVLGPTAELLPEESAALGRYFEGGGRILVALDPEEGKAFSGLLKPFGVRFVPTLLANDEAFFTKDRQSSDRQKILTASYSSHPAVTTLGKLGGRAALGLLGAGYLEEAPDRPTPVRVDFTVHSHPATWNDLNNNYSFDPPLESRKPWELAAAATLKRGPTAEEEGRALVLADSDVLSDLILRNVGNVYLALDGAKWLLGDDAIIGEVSKEADTPIQHTRKQDVAWFYSTIFLAPAVVLGAGFAATRRRKGAGKKAAASGGQS